MNRNFSTEERVNTALNLIGFGNPDASVWICGINERGECECSDKEIEKYFGKQYGPLDSKQNFNRTYNGY